MNSIREVYKNKDKLIGAMDMRNGGTAADSVLRVLQDCSKAANLKI